MKLLKLTLKTVFILLLVIIVIGLLLPQHYQAQKSVTIEADRKAISSLISDFNHWKKWSPWHKVDPTIKFTLGEPNSGLGAHQTWQSQWGFGEMTITTISENKISFNILFNQDHIINATITQQANGAAVDVICHVEGQANTPFLSGYMALLSEYVLTNTITLGLNNIKTVAQLEHEKQKQNPPEDPMQPAITQVNSL
ncbi:SRPBCC family protein [Pseudoalteromonas sp. MMG010]|uniref:SRPBCC family protein n=1 Tax=Pseudoalteromonas sp. MMG010 TaxID=2822685 RepID=UPI0032B5648A